MVEGCGDHGCEYMTGGTVVVLGPVGRNFAAGMSGGIAYVWDRDGGFRAQCNGAGVEVEAVDDPALLRSLVEQHEALTGSRRAGDLLSRWSQAMGEFVLVIPTEYRLALASREAA